MGAGRAIITVTATDTVGSNQSATQRFKVTVGNDYDSDDDRLVEIRTLAQLDAMRHNVDGGVISDDPAAYALAFPAPIDHMGCGIEGCDGYELEEDLDFDTNGNGMADSGDTYWNGGAGWTPIGTQVFFSIDTFNTTFEGNDHDIANLFISGGSHLGLFGGLGGSAIVSNLSLTNVDVTGDDGVGGLVGANQGKVIYTSTTGRVAGGDAVGGLAGQNRGVITRSSSSASATQTTPADNVHTPFLLPGVGGLVGDNFRGQVSESYATGAVDGYPAGGLAGSNHGTIVSSYATGPVTGTTVGGLVGRNGFRGRIYASYATGRVSGVLMSADWSGPMLDASTPAMRPGTCRAGETGAGWSGPAAFMTPPPATGTRRHPASVGEALRPSCRYPPATPGYIGRGTWTQTATAHPTCPGISGRPRSIRHCRWTSMEMGRRLGRSSAISCAPVPP